MYFKWIDVEKLSDSQFDNMILYCQNRLWRTHKLWGHHEGVNKGIEYGYEFLWNIYNKKYPENNIHYLLSEMWLLFNNIMMLFPKDDSGHKYMKKWIQDDLNLQINAVGEKSVKEYIEANIGLKVSFSEHLNYQ